MSVTITLSDTNNDGTGINFLSYLSDYDSNFTRSGWGTFNTTNPFDYSGTEFGFKNSDASTSVVLGSTSGGDDLEYEFSSHVLEGSLDSVSFGTGLSLDTVNNVHVQTTVDIEITGLNLTGTGTGNDVHTVAYDLMQGNDDELLNQFDNGVTYVSSTGKDVMAGFAGDDTFVFQNGSGYDTVNDFDTNGDLLDVSGWGVTSFAGLTINTFLGTSYVSDGTGDTIVVASVTGLDAADFVFA